MKDYQGVLAEAAKLGFHDTENWLHSNMKIYIQGVRYGILPEGHSTEGCQIYALSRREN